MAARKRIDPAPRPSDGSTDSSITGANPERDYVYVDPNAQQCGVQSYLGRGWDIETRSSSDVKILGGYAKGDELTFNGQVLMSRPREFGAAEFAKGQAMADRQQARISKEVAGDEHVRVIAPRAEMSDAFIDNGAA